MLSAGNSQDSAEPYTVIKKVAGILSKRTYVDWSNAKLDLSANRTEKEGPFEYLVQWEDEMLTWEPV